MSVDIAYIVSHGFAARMVTQTNLLGLLVKKGKKVALICPDKNDPNLVEYCSREKVKLAEFNPKSTFWTAQYSDTRKYFLEDINSNVALKEKHIWATKYNTSKNPIDHIRPRLAYVIYKLIKVFPSIRKWYKFREEKFLESKEATQILNELNPKILISTYPVNFSEAMLLKAGNQRKHTKTIIHLLSWDNITCKGHFPQLADMYIAWGPIMKEEFIEYYNINPDNIFICGVPHFDLHVKSKQQANYKSILKELNLNENLPYIFYGMSAPRFSPKEIDIVEWLANEISKNTFGKEIQLVVRPHPQNVQGGLADTSWLKRLQKIQGKKIAIDYPDLSHSKMPWSMQKEDMERLSQLLAGSAISLNSCSTLTIDSIVANVPVVLAVFDHTYNLDYWFSIKRVLDYPHLVKIQQTKAVVRTNNYIEFKDAINDYLNNSNLHFQERQLAFYQECGGITNATETVVNTLLENVCSN